MKREFGLEQIRKDTSSVVTVGTFDGVHVGHQAIIRYLVNRARERNGTSVVVSFSPHPREVVHGEEIPLLTTIDERADAVEKLGVDRFIIILFTREFSRLKAEEFVREILVDRIGLREIAIGYDHAFGRDRRGGPEMLKDLGEQLGFTVDIIPAQVVNEHVVSSSEIRELLAGEGDVALAEALLGRPYSLRGTVVRGDGRGRAIGFPTANLSVDHPRKVIPAPGVYAVRVEIPGRPAYGPGMLEGMMNIGYRPTFGSNDLAVEVHLLDFDDDLYGADLRVEFANRMRDEQKFESKQALVEQLSRDRSRCKVLLSRSA